MTLYTDRGGHWPILDQTVPVLALAQVVQHAHEHKALVVGGGQAVQGHKALFVGGGQAVQGHKALAVAELGQAVQGHKALVVAELGQVAFEHMELWVLVGMSGQEGRNSQ